MNIIFNLEYALKECAVSQTKSLFYEERDLISSFGSFVLLLLSHIASKNAVRLLNKTSEVLNPGGLKPRRFIVKPLIITKSSLSSSLEIKDLSDHIDKRFYNLYKLISFCFFDNLESLELLGQLEQLCLTNKLRLFPFSGFAACPSRMRGETLT